MSSDQSLPPDAVLGLMKCQRSFEDIVGCGQLE